MIGSKSIRPARRFLQIPARVAALTLYCCGIAALVGVLVSTDVSSAFAENHHSRGRASMGGSSGGQGGHVARSHSSEQSHAASHGRWARDRRHGVTSSGNSTRIAKSTSQNKKGFHGRSLNKSSSLPNVGGKTSSMTATPGIGSSGAMPSGGGMPSGITVRSVGGGNFERRSAGGGSGLSGSGSAANDNHGVSNVGPGRLTPKTVNETIDPAKQAAIDDCARRYPTYDRTLKFYTDANGQRHLCP